MLTGTEVDGLDGPRCAMTFNLPSFRLKWIAQFVNQTFQAWMSMIRCDIMCCSSPSRVRFFFRLGLIPPTCSRKPGVVMDERRGRRIQPTAFLVSQFYIFVCYFVLFVLFYFVLFHFISFFIFAIQQCTEGYDIPFMFTYTHHLSTSVKVNHTRTFQKYSK